MKSFAFAAIASLATADKSDFPRDTWNHCKCYLDADFGTDCNTLYSIMLPMIASWAPEPLDTPGTYTIKETASDDYIWSQRLTYNGKYIDDQMFEFESTGPSTCTVHGHSSSETVSMLDNAVNYCNLWNVYEGAEIVGVTTVTIGADHSCSQTPSNAVETCARY